MALKLGRRTAILSSSVSVEEAEPLAKWLRETPEPAVNLARCTHLHTAALQVLLGAGATITVAPADEFLAQWVAPLFRSGPVGKGNGAP